MKKRIKRKTKSNTNKLPNTDNLRNGGGRPMPMSPKAGITLNPRRYKFGGNA